MLLTDRALAHRRAIVVGSAPRPSFPAVGKWDVVVGANGGAGVARAAGLRVDSVATTSHLFRDGAGHEEAATLEQMRGLRVGTVWVDERNGPLRDVQARCEALDIKFLEMRGVPPVARDEVVYAAVGEPLWVSTGVWAACLAVVSGARPIVLVGIALAPGHEGIPGDRRHRDHVVEDRAALRRLAELGVAMPDELRREVAA